MLEEWSVWASYTLPIAGFACLLFLWNLVCAPYRNARDKSEMMARKVQDLAEKIEGFRDVRSFSQKLREMADRMQRFGIEYNSTRPAAKYALNFGVDKISEQAAKKAGINFQGNIAVSDSTDNFQLRMIMNLQNEREAYDRKWWADFGSQFGGDVHELLVMAKKQKLVEARDDGLLFELDSESPEYRRPEFYNELATLLRRIATKAEDENQSRIS